LPFATIPLIHFTSDARKMGAFVNRRWVKVLAWIIAVIIVTLNMKLVFDALSGWLGVGPVWAWAIVTPIVALVLGVLGYITFGPLFRPGHAWESGVVTDGQAMARDIKPLQIRHVGVALEHAEGDSIVLSAALSQARSYKARLTLVHVVDSPGTMLLGEQSGSLHGAEDAAYLESLVREVEDRDQPVESMLRFGRPAEELVKAVAEAGFDLMVMGSHGHRRLEGLVFGQTVSAVRRAVDIPVLVVRSYGHERAQRG